MLFIPGFLVAAVTFPGVIVHEFAHQLFCRIFRVPVYDVVYFQMKNPCGYVSHEPVDRPLASFMISVGPFLVNTVLGMLIVFPAAIELFQFRVYQNVMSLLLGWLGISILMHAFPSTGDAKVMVQSILKNPDVNLFAKVITAPVIGLVYLGAVGSMMWLDFLYAAAMAMVLPNLIVMMMK